jgi:hypothetical protein
VAILDPLFLPGRSVKQQLELSFLEQDPPLVLLETAVMQSPQDRFLRSLMDTPVRELGSMLGATAPDLLRLATRSEPLEQGVPRVVAQSADGPAPSLAVGYAMRSGGMFEIELRLQNATVSALLRAKELARRHGMRSDSVGIVRKLVTHSAPDPGALGNDPLTLGSSVGVVGGLAGTVGGFVRYANGARGVLSCSHVIARAGAGTKGDRVYHPSPNDDELGHRLIGRLDRFENMCLAGPRPFDAAVAVLEDGLHSGANTIPTGRDFPLEGSPLRGDARQAPLPPFAHVAKIGRNGWSKGRVMAENLGPLDVWFPIIQRYAKVSGMIEIDWESADKPFSREGDSGSMVYLEDGLEPVGLLVGGGMVSDGDRQGGRSYACPLTAVLDRWGLTLM